MKKVIIFLGLFIGIIMVFDNALEDGTLLNFMDTHPDQRWVPAVEYSLGSGYALFHDLQKAATFYIRIAERYPDSAWTDDALYGYIQARDESNTMDRAQLIEEYGKYLERFPNGKHVTPAQNRMDAYRTGSR